MSSDRPVHMEMPADELTLVEGHPYGRSYDKWLRQSHESHGGRWVVASAAGVVGEAMASLCADADAKYFVVAGWMEGLEQPMLYEALNGVPLPVRACDATPMAFTDALKARDAVSYHFFCEWMRGGADAGLKSWSVPFLLRALR